MHEGQRGASDARTLLVRMTRCWREAVLAVVVFAPLALFLAGDPIPQDLQYHAFADERTGFGVRNFFNVASNIPFLLVGVAGLWIVLAGAKIGASRSWAVFFIGTGLVSLGSGYYHWAPGNETLVWDRLAMTLGFMGLFVALVSEHVGEKSELVLLAAAVATGIASVAWWRHTDDLRLYYWVQLAPFLAILFVLVIFPGRYTRRMYLLYGLACYVFAKVAEVYDREIFALTSQSLSGHSLKHLLAAVGVLFVYLMLRRRIALPGQERKRAPQRPFWSD